MSSVIVTWVGEILAGLKAHRISYEEFLKHMVELARNVQAGKADDTPKQLDTPGKRALYNNLMLETDASKDAAVPDPKGKYGADAVQRALKLALAVDETVRKNRPDGWRRVQAREQVIKSALYQVLQDEAEVERLFLIIKQQKEY